MRQLAEALSVVSGETPEVAKTAGHGYLRNMGSSILLKLRASDIQPQVAQPPHRTHSVATTAVRMQGARTDARSLCDIHQTNGCSQAGADVTLRSSKKIRISESCRGRLTALPWRAMI